MVAADLINRIATALASAVFAPLAWMGPAWAMVVVSVIAGLLMLLAFGKLSNQRAIRVIRERIRGNLIGVRLYQHDLGVVARLQRSLLADTARYMGYTLVPMAVTIVPFVLILAQLNLRYSSRPLRPGEAAVVTARLRGPIDLAASPKLAAAGGAEIETPGVRAPARREVSWRIRASEAGRHPLAFTLGAEELKMNLNVGNGWGAVPSRRAGSGFLHSLLWPGERSIPGDSAFEEIAIAYPPLPLRVGPWQIPWLAMFLIVSIGAGFALKGAVGVEI